MRLFRDSGFSMVILDGTEATFVRSSLDSTGIPDSASARVVFSRRIPRRLSSFSTSPFESIHAFWVIPLNLIETIFAGVETPSTEIFSCPITLMRTGSCPMVAGSNMGKVSSSPGFNPDKLAASIIPAARYGFCLTLISNERFAPTL